MFGLQLLVMLCLVRGILAWWRMECPGALGLTRVDPIVSPGGPSQHLHSFHGSNAVGFTADTASLRAGSCTSCRASQDMSAYWFPVLYFQDARTGQLEFVNPVGGFTAYYKIFGKNVTAFPDNFQMIAGSTERRSFTPYDHRTSGPEKSRWAEFGLTAQKDFEQLAVGFTCLDKDEIFFEGALDRHYMPDKEFIDANCDGGLRAEIQFPSCWDGVNSAADDFKSHVLYPNLVVEGDCPETHPVRLPSLFYETVWSTSTFKGRKGRFVMSNGDPTGFGYHGDFIMGWDRNFLQAAIDTCLDRNGSMYECPLFDITTESEAASCKMEVPPKLEDERIFYGLTTLPGGVKISATEGHSHGKHTSHDNHTMSGNCTMYGNQTVSGNHTMPRNYTIPDHCETPTGPVNLTTSGSHATSTLDALGMEVNHGNTNSMANGNIVTKVLQDLPEKVGWVREAVGTTTDKRDRH